MRKGAPSVNPSGRAVRSDAGNPIADAGWVNLTTGSGVSGVDKRVGADIVYEPISPQKGLEYWLADDMAARIVEELPDAAFQEGYELKIGEDKSAQELMPPKPKAVPGEKPSDSATAPKEEPAPADAPPGVTVNIHAPPPAKKARRDADYASAEAGGDLGEVDEATEGESTDTDKPGKEPEELREWLDERMKKLGVVEKLTRAAKLERACNGAAVLLGALDNGTMDQPLNLETVRSFDWMTIIEAQEMSPVAYYADPSKPNFGEVELWAITPQSPGPSRQGAETYYPGGRILVHETRLIVFPGILVSRFQRRLLAGFGDNVWSRVFEVLRDFNASFGSAAALVSDFGQAVWAIKGLAQLLAMDGNRAFRDRVAAMELARSALRATVVDAEGESFSRVATPVTGLPDLLSALERRLAAAAGMPLTRLMGMSPGGLNATGESDEKYWNARVKSFQVNRLEPALKRIIEILIKVSGQKVDTWCIEWRDLRQLTELEQATLQKTVADTDVANIGAGIYTPEEAAVAHFSGDKFKPGIKLDFSARAMAERMEQQQTKMQQELEVAKASGAPPGIGGPPKPGAAPAQKADQAMGVGTRVRVKKGKAHDSMTADVEGKIVEIGGSALGVKFEGASSVHHWYTADDLEVIGGRKDAFDPDQPRDENGRWGEGGGSSHPAGDIKQVTKIALHAQKEVENVARAYTEEQRKDIYSTKEFAGATSFSPEDLGQAHFEHHMRAHLEEEQALQKGIVKAPPSKVLERFHAELSKVAKPFQAAATDVDRHQREALEHLRAAEAARPTADDDDNAPEGIDIAEARELFQESAASSATAARASLRVASGEFPDESELSGVRDAVEGGYAEEEHAAGEEEQPPSFDRYREHLTAAADSLAKAIESHTKLLEQSKVLAKVQKIGSKAADDELDDDTARDLVAPHLASGEEADSGSAEAKAYEEAYGIASQMVDREIERRQVTVGKTSFDHDEVKHALREAKSLAKEVNNRLAEIAGRRSEKSAKFTQGRTGLEEAKARLAARKAAKAESRGDAFDPDQPRDDLGRFGEGTHANVKEYHALHSEYKATARAVHSHINSTQRSAMESIRAVDAARHELSALSESLAPFANEIDESEELQDLFNADDIELYVDAAPLEEAAAALHSAGDMSGDQEAYEEYDPADAPVRVSPPSTLAAAAEEARAIRDRIRQHAVAAQDAFESLAAATEQSIPQFKTHEKALGKALGKATAVLEDDDSLDEHSGGVAVALGEAKPAVRDAIRQLSRLTGRKPNFPKKATK